MTSDAKTDKPMLNGRIFMRLFPMNSGHFENILM